MEYKTAIKDKQDIFDAEFCDKVRKRLNLTKKQLKDADIRKVTNINNKLISEWILNNADGFRIKDNGIICISKYLPKCLRGDKEQKIEEILANPKNDAYMKDMFIKRYNKSMEFYKTRKKEGAKYWINLHSFFHIYRVIWFNSRNCKFDKAELYELKASEPMKDELNKKIIGGKDYFIWQFSDFRERRTKDKEERKILLEKKNSLKKQGKIEEELE